MRAQALLLFVLASAGCTLQNLTPKARFQDAAYTLNDAARWGQVDLATQYVSPKYVGSFISRHRLWGEQISIADAELVRLQIKGDKQGAHTIVSLSWYDKNGIMLHTSTIAQTWTSVRGTFKLIDEKVSGGDPSIFAEPEPGGEATEQ